MLKHCVKWKCHDAPIVFDIKTYNWVCTNCDASYGHEDSSYERECNLISIEIDKIIARCVNEHVIANDDDTINCDDIDPNVYTYNYTNSLTERWKNLYQRYYYLINYDHEAA